MNSRNAETFFTAAACPQVRAVRQELKSRRLSRGIEAACVAHLAEPTLSAAALATAANATSEEVRVAYRLIREDPQIAGFVGSLFYPHRLRTAFAARTVSEWLADPSRPRRLLAGEAMQSSTVELHPSKGTCSFRCTMCLWSDNEVLTYAARGLTADGLLAMEDWCRILKELHTAGARTVVLSGGGEALLNPGLPALLRDARKLGLSVHLYTSGFNLSVGRRRLWEEVMQLTQVRFSIHSPFPSTYDAITGLTPQLSALARVTSHLDRLLRLRRQQNHGPRVGVGFVVQPLNHTQVSAMADYAVRLGVDFLDIRKDEVGVTDGLTAVQLSSLTRQLRMVRAAAIQGGYGQLRVDLGDELVAIANGQLVRRRRTSECLAKYFRPTISPYGLLAPCDLKAEPRFADSAFDLGAVARKPLAELTAGLSSRYVADRCGQCMPSSRTGNAVYHKLLADLRYGLALADQPFTPSSAADAAGSAVAPGR